MGGEAVSMRGAGAPRPSLGDAGTADAQAERLVRKHETQSGARRGMWERRRTHMHRWELKP